MLIHSKSPIAIHSEALFQCASQSSVNSQTNDCPCYWHFTPVIKHLSESALAQLCKFSSGRCFILSWIYGVDLYALVGWFKTNVLQCAGALMGNPLRLPLGGGGGSGDGGGGSGVFYSSKSLHLSWRSLLWAVDCLACHVGHSPWHL